ncbi:hypothetical protein ABHI18_003636 [Aspergillus niger]
MPRRRSNRLQRPYRPYRPPQGLQPNMPRAPDEYLRDVQCILCGDILYDNRGVWRAHYRALYQAAGSVELSGIGYKSGWIPLKVPTDPDKRWGTMGDDFCTLPIELIELLVGYLSTQDYLNSRLASRSMGVLFHKQRFWKTKFDINGERGFLNYLVKEHQNLDFDWRLLYHSTCRLRCSRLFDITIRLWEINRWIREALICKSRGTFASFMDFGGRALQYYHNTMWPETKYRQTVRIPPDLIKIGVSAFIELGESEVTIRGLELIRASGPSILLGEKIPGSLVFVEEVDDHGGGRPDWDEDNRTSYCFPGIEVILDAQTLQGFMITNTVNGRLTHLQLIRQNGFSKPIGICYLNGASYVFQMDDIVNLVVEFDMSSNLRQLGIQGFGSNQKAEEWERDGYYKITRDDDDDDE